MRMIRGFDAIRGRMGPVAAGMGNFDGVHLGHRAILLALMEASGARGVPACAVTFHPHPLKVLAPERAPAMIQTLEDRLSSLEATGVDNVLVVPFTLKFAEITAERFVEEYLAERLGCVELFVGDDARFGRGRAGDVEMLRRYGERGLFEFHLVPAIEVDGVRVSSSGIRKMVVSGDVEGAARWIGRPFSMAGEVVTGVGRGRTLGFPTANVLADGETKPADGVYACTAESPAGRWPAAVHSGPIPTFGCGRPVVEAHLLDFSGDLVGTRLRLHFLKRLRGVMQFPGPPALIEQIGRDCEETRGVCESY